MQAAWQKYLDNETITSLSGLRIHYPRMFSGSQEGSHRSGHVGQALEFSQYRQYAPGDDVRYIDWKMFGRSDKYYLRQSEVERSLTSHVVVDHSSSMSFAGPRRHETKLDFAKRLAMAIAYLSIAGRDPVGLATISEHVQSYCSPSMSPEQLSDIANVFDQTEPVPQTDLHGAIQSLIGKTAREGLIIVISDFLDHEDSIPEALRLIRDAGHEAIILHVMDRAERDFQFDADMRFSDLEQHGELDLNASSVGQSYRQEVERFIVQMRTGAHQLGFGYSTVMTDEPLRSPLFAHFSP